MHRKAEVGGFWCVEKWCCAVGCMLFYVPSNIAKHSSTDSVVSHTRRHDYR